MTGTSDVARAQAQRRQVDADATGLRIQIEMAVVTAHEGLLRRQDAAARYRRTATETAEALARIGRVAYQEGELTILELLDAERQALEAELTALELSARARLARIELDRAVGAEVQP